MSICALGIMGTRYIRNVALPEEIEVVQGSLGVLEVEQVYSEFEIGN